MKLRLWPAAAVAGAAVVALAVPAADAHTPEVTASCTQGLHVSLKAYDRDTTVSITVDGDTANTLRFTFTGDFEYTYSLRTPGTFREYLVVIDNVGTTYDRTIRGQAGPCATTITTSAPGWPPTTESAPVPTYPATPPCPYPGLGAFDWNSPECVEVLGGTLTAVPAAEAEPAIPVLKTPVFTG